MHKHTHTHTHSTNQRQRLRTKANGSLCLWGAHTNKLSDFFFTASSSALSELIVTVSTRHITVHWISRTAWRHRRRVENAAQFSNCCVCKVPPTHTHIRLANGLGKLCEGVGGALNKPFLMPGRLHLAKASNKLTIAQGSRRLVSRRQGQRPQAGESEQKKNTTARRVKDAREQTARSHSLSLRHLLGCCCRQRCSAGRPLRCAACLQLVIKRGSRHDSCNHWHLRISPTFFIFRH